METLRIILDLILILLGLYIVLFKAYLSQKGKNLATKEDIKAITEKIESVKYSYQKKGELDKKELGLNNDLYDALNEFQNCIQTVNNNKTQEDLDRFSQMFELTRNAINKLHISHAATYYAHYENVGSRLDKSINDFLNAQRAKDQVESLKQINIVTSMIEDYKKEIFAYIKK